jgi:ankyrin repeat protein
MAAAPESKSPEELLCAAAKSGEEEEVAKLLASGADATHFDADGLTPLMHAAAGGTPPLRASSSTAVRPGTRSPPRASQQGT